MESVTEKIREKADTSAHRFRQKIATLLATYFWTHRRLEGATAFED
jgi:hypothetical protein